MKKIPELKPCPFCGGRVILGRGIDCEITGILCRSCHVMVKWDIQMRSHETFGENETKWAEKWNRRDKRKEE